MATPVRDAQWVEWMARLMGAASRQQPSAALPPERFHCLLDELPLHLVPQGVLDRKRLRDEFSQPLIFNPACQLLPSGEVPMELQTRQELLQGFCLQGTTAWVQDRAFGTLHPFWLGSKLDAMVSSIRSGELADSSLPEDWKFLLARAEILVPQGHAESRQERRRELVNRSARLFQENGYAPLGRLIHPFHVAALRRYYRYQIRRGFIRLGDGQCSSRYVAHNESVARYFHHQLANIVAAMVGEPVKPSYVYMASYVSGAELRKHTDRKQCEFSVSLCLDFSPEPERATSWPLHLETYDDTVTVYQALGDGLLYRGTKVPHYRRVLPEGQTSTSIFFHYVSADFSGPLD